MPVPGTGRIGIGLALWRSSRIGRPQNVRRARGSDGKRDHGRGHGDHSDGAAATASLTTANQLLTGAHGDEACGNGRDDPCPVARRPAMVAAFERFSAPSIRGIQDDGMAAPRREGGERARIVIAPGPTNPNRGWLEPRSTTIANTSPTVDLRCSVFRAG